MGSDVDVSVDEGVNVCAVRSAVEQMLDELHGDQPSTGLMGTRLGELGLRLDGADPRRAFARLPVSARSELRRMLVEVHAAMHLAVLQRETVLHDARRRMEQDLHLAHLIDAELHQFTDSLNRSRAEFLAHTERRLSGGRSPPTCGCTSTPSTR
jgi:hypothetical protein